MRRQRPLQLPADLAVLAKQQNIHVEHPSCEAEIMPSTPAPVLRNADHPLSFTSSPKSMAEDPHGHFHQDG
jgi:hypothetical protein